MSTLQFAAVVSFHLVSLCVSSVVVQMGEEYYHAKDYTKALK